jgi:hypothetical protein
MPKIMRFAMGAFLLGVNNDTGGTSLGQDAAHRRIILFPGVKRLAFNGVK